MKCFQASYGVDTPFAVALGTPVAALKTLCAPVRPVLVDGVQVHSVLSLPKTDVDVGWLCCDITLSSSSDSSSQLSGHSSLSLKCAFGLPPPPLASPYPFSSEHSSSVSQVVITSASSFAVIARCVILRILNYSVLQNHETQLANGLK